MTAIQTTTLRGAQKNLYSQILWLGEAKEGKTCYLVAQALGVHPFQTTPPKDPKAAAGWKRLGGVVTSPKHLHVVDMDTATLVGVPEYLLRCGLPQAQVDRIQDEVDVISLQVAKLEILNSTTRGDTSFYAALVHVCSMLEKRVAALPGTHVVIPSSWTTMCGLVEKGLFGDLAEVIDGKLQNADQSIWSRLKQELVNVQLLWQSGPWHTWWEGHVTQEDVPDPTNPRKTVKKDTLMAHGAGALRWPITTGLNLRIGRNPGVHVGDGLEEQYIDTKSKYKFLPGSRGNLALQEKELDATDMLRVLKYQIGGYIPQ